MSFKEYPLKRSRVTEGTADNGTRTYYYPDTDCIGATAQYKDGKQNGIETHYYRTGEVEREYPFVDGMRHGVIRDYTKAGELGRERYVLYGDDATEEEYRRHELTRKVAGI